MVRELATRVAAEDQRVVLLTWSTLILAVTLLLVVAVGVGYWVRQDGAIHYVAMTSPGLTTSVPDQIPLAGIEALSRPILLSLVNYTYHTIDATYATLARQVHPRISAHFEAWSMRERAYVKTAKLSSIAALLRVAVQPDVPRDGLFTLTATAHREVLLGSVSGGLKEVQLSLTVMPAVGANDHFTLYVVDYDVPQHSDAPRIQWTP